MIKKAILFLMFFSGCASAVDFVYRVDSRPPDVIFRDGFGSHGNNRNLQQHIRGDSCAGGSRDSNYIATTSDINETYSIAAVYYSNAAFSGRLYRYRIRADNSFYSLAPSVDYIESRGIQFSYFERVMMRLQSEYVAVNSIPIENIQEAVELVYDRNTSQVRDGPGTSNSRYLRVSTQSNSGVIPNLPVPQLSTRERISAFGTLISACFSMRGVRRDDEHLKFNYYDVEFYDARGVLTELLN
ncbi:TPA: pertussis toxin-like subunit ArtA [Salmonella enterica subsp. enterica serovar Kivu]|uniref:Pertussis toxin-like subunit ArtA n=2 Tax=Salmonella enterica TaxID=28901 RepID=A0A763M8G2_SALER|nr:pertussis toxin-like subunit ArtA [Salmonella enterica]AZS99925.1 pertussis toxin-like subunit ArtA [Salmonella enterica subsp. enterica serovar Mikawasima]AZT76359.1 pertussis toxin-like subunit ArtA [Salmonella enterica subsp. enterica serovar Bareilly]EAA6847614.1 pertussis toxin-like subunit ArtA [Salmonella enterica subsp. enterica serovar Stanleyville]EAA7336470.1 pertussis toxin-like subunit ArtA [Salmonella enterica subsp. enterica]EBG0409561.1 pertussis toxin-like subunit ArtA [Sal